MSYRSTKVVWGPRKFGKKRGWAKTVVFEIWESRDGTEGLLIQKDSPDHDTFIFDVEGRKMRLIEEFRCEGINKARCYYKKWNDRR